MSIEIKTKAEIGARMAELNRGAPEDRIGAKGRSGGSGSIAANDTLTLTRHAARLAGLMDAMAAAPVENSERVERIRVALANGEYTVDADRIARKLIAFEGGL